MFEKRNSVFQTYQINHISYVFLSVIKVSSYWYNHVIQHIYFMSFKYTQRAHVW